MSTEVVMPQMGESIAEGTITRWLKQVGDRVERDEPLFEISTDKVDAEIPSPAAGTLNEVRFKEGDTVEINTVVAVLGEAGETAAAAASTPTADETQNATAQAPAATQPPPTESPAAAQVAPDTTGTHPADTAAAAQIADQNTPATVDATNTTQTAPAQAQTPPPIQPPTSIAAASSGAEEDGGNGAASVEDLRRTRSSPLVRKIAQEHNVDIAQLEGTGMSGRVTKNDILSFIDSGATSSTSQPAASVTAQPAAAAQPVAAQTIAPPASVPTFMPGAPPQQSQASTQLQTTSPVSVAQQPPPVHVLDGDRVEQMSVMRKKIAEHMTMSQRTSAHVATVYEIDMTRIAKLRDKHKRQFQETTGTKLTFMPFIFQAVTSAIRQFPVFNSQVAGDQIVYKRDINLGMAVALDWGLIVPVIKRADELSLAGLAKSANDLAERARNKQLKPDEVAGGTFTITNPGVFGGLFGTPIINQPQVAILGLGTIEKRPHVMTDEEGNDYLAIRSMAYFALSYDHRVIDGSDAEKFLGYIKRMLEAGQFTV